MKKLISAVLTLAMLACGLVSAAEAEETYQPPEDRLLGVASNGSIIVRGVSRHEPYQFWDEHAKKFWPAFAEKGYCEYSYDGIEWHQAVLPGIDAVGVMVWPTPLPYNGKTFVLLNGGDALGCYYSEDGINWTMLPDHGDWAGGTRGILDTQFVWTGTEYITRLAGYSSGVMFQPAIFSERLNSVCFFDEDFNLTGQHDLGAPITGVGYLDGVYYAQTGTDGVGDRKIYQSADKEKWTESERKTIPAAAGWSPTNKAYYVTINGEYRTFDQLIYSKNDRIMAPLRGVAETLGFTVEWDQQSGQAVCAKGDVTVRVDIGADTATVNGVAVTLDVPSELKENRTYVPLRFFAQSFGLDVDWNQETLTAVLTD